jgi:hypothetical protein
MAWSYFVQNGVVTNEVQRYLDISTSYLLNACVCCSSSNLVISKNN